MPFLLLLSVLLLLFNLRALQVSCEYSHEKLSPLYLLVLAPYPDPDGRPQFNPVWTGGPGLIPAARLAVEHINNRSDVLTDYHVTLVEGHSGCDIFSQTFEIYTEEVFHSGKNIIGILGPACSASTLELGKLIGPERVAMAQVSISVSPLLTDRDTYPYSVSVISSSGSYMDVFLKMMENYNWNRFALMYSSHDAYHISTATTFKEKLAKANRSYTLEYVSALSDTYLPLTQLRQSNVRIILAVAPPGQASKLMCLAYQYGMIFPTYQWVFIDRTVSEFNETTVSDMETKYKCDNVDIRTAIEGSIFLQYKLVTSTPNMPTYSGITYYEFEREYHEKVEEHEQELGISITDQPYATTYYDITWAMALSLNNSIEPLKEMNMSLLDYRPQRRDITDVIKQQFYAQDFEGVSGKFHFDNSTGHSISFFDLFQVYNGTAFIVGYYDPFSTDIISHGNGTFISDSFQIRYIKANAVALAIVLAVTAVQLGVTIFFHVVNVVYSRHKSIKASSPPLNHLIFSGCYLMVTCITICAIQGAFPPRNLVIGGVLFNTVLWSSNISFGLVLGTICMKTWRLYQIFTGFRNPGSFLSNPVLIIAVLLILLPLLILCTIVTIIDPALYKEERRIVTHGNLPPVIEVRAQWVFSWSYVIAGLYFAILFTCALCFSILSRHVKRSDFKSTKSINFLLYSIILLSGIGLPLYWIAVNLHWNVHISYFFLCGTSNALLFVWLLFLFLPSIIPLAKEKWPNKWERIFEKYSVCKYFFVKF